MKPILKILDLFKRKKMIIIKILLFLFFNFIIFINYDKLPTLIYSEKWIVMTAFNSPTSFFINFTKTINNWKIIVISNSNNIKINNDWKLLNFTNNLIYLTIKDQINLSYKITKYLELNSYSRKNIGYLYAIQHGAKEIYEINEDILITNINDLNFKLDNKNVFYGIRNDSRMINPYNYFEQKNIWPRGFRIKDIGNDNNKTLNYKLMI